jgi:hypothetical protein
MSRLIFPCINIALAIRAACVYAYQKDYRHAIYWGSAALLTASVIF